MKLPNGENAYVERSKMTGYLLSLTHPDGAGKAGLFRQFGFDQGTLENTLIAVARSEKVKEEIPTRWGTNYVIEADVPAPNPEPNGQHRSVHLRTVWELRHGDDRPRLVTAFIC